MICCGVDEVGRGPLAGPVVAAAVILPATYTNQEIRDSKQLSKKIRDELNEEIRRVAICWSIVAVGPRRIDIFNIREATRMAMAFAVRRLRLRPELVRIDGNMRIPIRERQETIVGGDALVLEISAASILAKVYRDRLMETLDVRYPGYELGRHAGYPTKIHRRALERLGPSRIHRRTFHGVLPISEASASMVAND